MTYAEIKKKAEELSKQKNQAAKELIQEIVETLFSTEPGLKEFSWHQYTPGFCDGDPCYFRTTIDYPDVNGASEDEEDEDLPYDSKLASRVGKALSVIDEDDLERLYGDGVTVTFIRGLKTPEIESYDCGY